MRFSQTQNRCFRCRCVHFGFWHSACSQISTYVVRLTLRRLMSCIYMEHPFLMFLDHTQRRSTVGRTPLDEWSARRRDLYLTTHDTHNRQISMPPVAFEPKISAGERPCRSPAEIVGSNPTGAWIFVCCECRVLSGRSLCDELIPRPEESYWLWCVVVCDLETARTGAPYIYDISSLRINQPDRQMSDNTLRTKPRRYQRTGRNNFGDADTFLVRLSTLFVKPEVQ